MRLPEADRIDEVKGIRDKARKAALFAAREEHEAY
jgi:hypothetical protein